MSALKLRLFGAFALYSDNGTEIPVRFAKERALIAYLALNPGKRMTRGHLAGLLWGEQPESRARHSLSQALSSIGRTLGTAAQALERSRQEICLAEKAIEIDVAEFRSLAESGDASDRRRALALYDSDLLADADFEEPAFDDWAYALRAECHGQALRAGLSYLAEDAGGDIAERIGVAQRLVRLDPCCEPAHQALMRLYCESQQLGAAIRQFETCRSALQEELGIDPGPETQRLIRQLNLENRSSPDDPPDVAESEPARDTPSLVVLPIVNLAGDPALDYLADGVTDDITTEMTRYHSLFVISRDSAFASEIRPEDASITCRRFGVRHALRGSLRRSGRGFRINLRLVDGSGGQNVWGERYDLSQEELLDLPPEVAGQVVARLAVWLERDALVRAHRKPAKDWSAYDHILQGLEYHHRNWYGIHNTLRAIQHFERAVEIDPDCARGYAYLACAKSYPWFKDRRHERLDPCMDLARHAVELDPTEAEAHRILGGVHLVRAEHELSRVHFEEAQRVNPGHAHVLAHAARYHMHSGDPKKAAGLLSRARQLNPLHPPWYWEHVGINAFVKRDYEAALTAFSRMQRHSFYDQLYATAANAHLGRKRHAAHHLALVLEKRPRLGLSNVSYFLPYRNRADLDHVLEGLGKAGLPN